MFSWEYWLRLWKRGYKYTIVGVSTFWLDMVIMYGLIMYTPTPHWAAVALGFLIGVSINYAICYHWVFKGTERIFHHGYVYFISLAILGTIIISSGTMFLNDGLELPLFMSRVIMGLSTGTIGFFINSYFNFKLL